ncbi:MAG: cation diffusion facilitator family transporter [Actinomycetota bacterium]|nr:cation diffusion facilitator family transporter [Actinomycetota bacterium]
MPGRPDDAIANQRTVERFMVLSLGAALSTMAIKAVAAGLTGSVGLLSDALESSVNLVAAVVGLIALRVSARPPDHNHQFGHGNAEYLSAAVEGAMVLVAAGAIVWTSIERLLDPRPLERAGIGLAISVGAALINLAVGLLLLRAGREHRSITLTADGHHLLTDVWTSVGVVAAVGVVAVTGWEPLDPIIGIAVGVNIVRIGYRLVRNSVIGLLDATLPPEDVARVSAVVEQYRAADHVDIRALRTRESGRRRFVYATVLVPEDWSVRRGHDLLDRFEADMRRELPGVVVFTHLEPLEPPGPR